MVVACTSEPSGPRASPGPDFATDDLVEPNMTAEGCEILPEQCPSRYLPDKPPPPDYAGNLHNFNTSTALNEPT